MTTQQRTRDQYEVTLKVDSEGLQLFVLVQSNSDVLPFTIDLWTYNHREKGWLLYYDREDILRLEQKLAIKKQDVPRIMKRVEEQLRLLTGKRVENTEYTLICSMPDE